MGRVVMGVRAALASRRVIVVAAAVALVLSLSALSNGLVIDDYFQRHVALEGRGYFPEHAIHPLRPLSAATHVIDYRLWEGHPSRNLVIAATFGVLSLVLHHRARHDGWAPGRWLAPLASAAALFSAEFGLGCLGYLLAYAAIYERGPVHARLSSVAPYLVVFVAWQSTVTARAS